MPDSEPLENDGQLLEDNVLFYNFIKANPDAPIELVPNVSLPEELILGYGYGYAFAEDNYFSEPRRVGSFWARRAVARNGIKRPGRYRSRF